MDMDSSSTSSVMSMMTPWLHFEGGDKLFFEEWAPASPGAIAGAAIGLFAVALFERWLTAMRSVLESHWRRRAFTLLSDRSSKSFSSLKSSSVEEAGKCCDDTDVSAKNLGSLPAASSLVRTIPPFIISHDIPRGIVHAVQAFLGYLLMLAVMTFQAAYIIAIIGGLGIGEVIFGRMALAH